MFGAVIAILLQLGHKHNVTGIPMQSGKHYMTSHLKPKPVLHTVLGFYWAVNTLQTVYFWWYEVPQKVCRMDDKKTLNQAESTVNKT